MYKQSLYCVFVSKFWFQKTLTYSIYFNKQNISLYINFIIKCLQRLGGGGELNYMPSKFHLRHMCITPLQFYAEELIAKQKRWKNELV